MNHRRVPPPGFLLGATSLLLVSPAAQAHLVETGFGAFYDGALHQLLTPETCLTVLGLGLLAGQAGQTAARRMLLALPLAWLVGVLLGTVFPVAQPWAWLNPLTFCGLGLLIALNRPPAPLAAIALAALIGAWYGASEGAAAVTADKFWQATAGSTTAIFVLFTLVAALVVSIQAAWTRVAIRVAGSWLAAVGIFMLGWYTQGCHNC